MVDIPVNIKDYIVKSRQAGLLDSKIIQSLEQSNWPDDVINMAVQEANSIIQPVAEPAESPQISQPKEEPKNKKKQIKNYQGKSKQESELVNSALNQKPEKKGFCFLTLIALLFSPVPFIGLGIAMTSLDIIRKKNKTGAIIAVFALIINIAVLLFVVFLIIQLLTLNPSQLQGVSKFIVESLGIL